MKRWLGRAFPNIVFAVALLVLGFAVGQYYLQKAYQLQMEASYRRALREFAVHLTELSQDLGKARVISGSEQAAALAEEMRSRIAAAQASLQPGEIDLSRLEQMMWQCYGLYAYSAGQLSSAVLDALLSRSVGPAVEYRPCSPARSGIAMGCLEPLFHNIAGVLILWRLP